jgi:hypothetical protein
MKETSISKSYGKMGLSYPFLGTEDDTELDKNGLPSPYQDSNYSGAFISKEQEKARKAFTQNRETGKVMREQLGKLNY